MPDLPLSPVVGGALGDDAALRARQIVRNCVRCGMCTAVCPTYALTGDELDGPRGRIHLVRDLLQNGRATPAAVRHLDRCLGCRACESACPSGVQYGELADIGKQFIRQNNPDLRTPTARITRAAAAAFLAKPFAVKTAAAAARVAKPLLPPGLQKTIAPPTPPTSPARPSSVRQSYGKFQRKIIALPGCVESQFAPGALNALRKIAAAVEVEVAAPNKARCCGALRLHLGMREKALDDIAQTLRAWSPEFADGAEAAMSPSSGCEAVMREYHKLLPGHPDAPKRILNPAEFVMDEWEKIAPKLRPLSGRIRVAFHAPCTLQNAVRMAEKPATILARAGFEPVPPANPHMCCGSAGTYSLLQPKMARELRRQKVENLQALKTDRAATANVGCQLFLSAKMPVVHWLELLAERLQD